MKRLILLIAVVCVLSACSLLDLDSDPTKPHEGSTQLKRESTYIEPIEVVEEEEEVVRTKR